MAAEKGYSKASRSARIFCEPAESVRCIRLSGGIYPAVQRHQMRFYPGIVDAQELGDTGHGIDVKVLALGPLFVHELNVRVGVLEDRTGDHEQGFSQMGGTAFRDAAGLGVKGAGLERRRVHARKSLQSALVGKPPHIADFRHEPLGRLWRPQA